MNPKKNITAAKVVAPEVIDVEAIMNRSDAIESEIVKEALNDLQKQREEQKAKILNVIAVAQKNVSNAIVVLRSVRDHEKKAKAQLEKFAKAEANLIKTGDVEAYANEIYLNDSFGRSEFLRRFGFKE